MKFLTLRLMAKCQDSFNFQSWKVSMLLRYIDRYLPNHEFVVLNEISKFQFK